MPALLTRTSTPPKCSRAAAATASAVAASPTCPATATTRAPPPRLLRARFELLRIAPVEEQVRAFGEEAPGQVEADAAAGPGDDDSIDPVRHWCSLLSPSTG